MQILKSPKRLCYTDCMRWVAGKSDGYTILEVMIFLAVSGFLFVIAASFINGKQAQSDFTQSVHDITDQMQGVLDNVANGRYPYPGGSGYFSCTYGPLISQASQDMQGQNKGCIFVGDVVQLGVSNAGYQGDGYAIYPVVGNQYANGSGTDTLASSFAEVNPTPIYGFNKVADDIQTGGFGYGTVVHSMYLVDTSGGGSKTPISAFGVFSEFGTYDGNNLLVSSAQHIRLTTIPDPNNLAKPLSYTMVGNHIEGVPIGGPSGAVQGIKSLKLSAHVLGSTESIHICLLGGNNKPASIILGSANHQMAATLELGADIPLECLS